MTPRPKAQRDHAVALLANGATIADVHHTTHIPKQTLSDWARKAGLDLAGRSEAKTAAATKAASAKWAEVRADLADVSGAMAAEAAGHIRTLMSSGQYLEAQRLVAVFGVGVDKAQLLTGEATTRSDHVGLREELSAQAEGTASKLRAVS